MKKIILHICLFCIFNPIQSQNNWSSEGSLGTTSERRHRGVGFSIGDKGYVGTGTRGSFGNTGYRELKDFWEYDPVTKVWTQLADLAGSSRYDAVGFSVGNKGYIGSGTHLSPSSGDVYLEDFWEYDRTSNSWTYIGDILGGPRFGAVAFVIGTKAYVGTGWSPSTGHTTDFFEFDPSNNYTWTQKSSLPGVPRTYATGFSICNKGYLGTGLIANNTGISDFYEYDPSTNTWMAKPNYGGGACYGAKGFSICTKGFMLKGAHNGTCDSKKFWEYDPELNTWIQRTDIPGEFRFHPIAFSIKNKGYIGTGKKCGEETYFTDFLSYTPISAEAPDQPGPVTGKATVCQRDVETYSINPISCAESYTWTGPPGSLVISGQGTTTITIDFSNANSGNISVSAVNGCGISPPRSSAITINPYPSITTSEPTTICSGHSTPLNAVGASFYFWSPSTGLSNPIVPNPIANPTETTLYTVIGTTNGCSDTSTLIVTVNPTPIVVSGGDAQICEGTSTQISADGASTYLWSPNSGLSDPTNSFPIASPDMSTNYMVIGTSNGCSDTSFVEIIVKPTPAKPDTIYGNLSVCQNTAQTYYITNDPSATGYMWTLPGWPGSSVDTAITSIASLSGYISVVAINNGCVSLSDSIYILVSSIPQSPDTILGQHKLCGLISNSFSVNPVMGASNYIWTLPPGWSTPSMSNAITVQAGESGLISVSSANFCGLSGPATLHVTVYDSLPVTPVLLDGDLSPCINSAIEYELVNQSDAYQFLWQLPESWIGTSINNIITTNVGDQDGNLTAIAINACGQSNQMVVPVEIVDIDTTIILSSDQLMVNQPNGTYQWIDCITGDSIPNATNQVFTPNQNGMYQVAISYMGCEDVSSCIPFISTSIEVTAGIEFTVTPNPSPERFRVSGDWAEIDDLKIYDLNGELIAFRLEDNGNSKDISLEHAETGIYLLTIKSKKNTHVIKLVKI